jgi:hypothetical protein
MQVCDDIYSKRSIPTTTIWGFGHWSKRKISGLQLDCRMFSATDTFEVSMYAHCFRLQLMPGFVSAFQKATYRSTLALPQGTYPLVIQDRYGK